jgi:DNA-binding transcriptional LysR family regulator
MRGSDFAELKAFVAVVERASFARAAEHLGLSPSALSQTIRQLEDRLGVRLLNRTTRSVAPTAAGEQLHARVAPLFRDMADAVAEASAAAGQTNGTLRINTLGMDDRLSDIVAGRFDAGIRVGARLEKDMIAVRLTPDLKMVAVASPEYLKDRGVPHAPADLHSHACINWRLQEDGRAWHWVFEKKGKRLEISAKGPLVTNDADIGVAAAVQGLGIAYAFDLEHVDAHLAHGRLVQVLGDWSITRPGLFLYYSNRRNPSPALGAFIDSMLDREPRASDHRPK